MEPLISHQRDDMYALPGENEIEIEREKERFCSVGRDSLIDKLKQRERDGERETA